MSARKCCLFRLPTKHGKRIENSGLEKRYLQTKSLAAALAWETIWHYFPVASSLSRLAISDRAHPVTNSSGEWAIDNRLYRRCFKSREILIDSWLVEICGEDLKKFLEEFFAVFVSACL